MKKLKIVGSPRGRLLAIMYCILNGKQDYDSLPTFYLFIVVNLAMVSQAIWYAVRLLPLFIIWVGFVRNWFSTFVSSTDSFNDFVLHVNVFLYYRMSKVKIRL